MRKLLLLFFTLLTIKGAQASVLLNQFSIQSAYLQNGKLKPASSGSTTFNADFTFSQLGTSYNTVKVTLVYSADYVNYTTLSSDSWYYDGDWNTSNPTWQSSISGTLPAGNTSGQIFLRYQVFDGSNAGAISYSQVAYGVYVPVDPGTQPPSNPPVAGSVPLYEFQNPNTGIHFYSTAWSNYSGYSFSRILGYVFTTQQPGTVPLYRYNGTGYHYSLTLASNFGTYVYSGIACYVYASQITKTLPIYRHYRASNGDNYLFDGPATFTNYSFEDIKFYVLQNQQPSDNPLPEEDMMELYQYYSTKGDHFYTTLKANRTGFAYERVLGYVHTIQKPGTVPLYRYYNSTSPAEDHYYTIVKQTYANYVYEGIVGYVYASSGTTGTIGIYQYYYSGNGDHYYHTVNTSLPNLVNEGLKFYLVQYPY